jgi:hypothetical protein
MIPERYMLTGRVGRDCSNFNGDVAKVRQWLGALSPGQGGGSVADGDISSGRAVVQFQRIQFPQWPRWDGQIWSDGTTHRRLVSLVTSPQDAEALQDVVTGFVDGFYQAEEPWGQMRLNNSSRLTLQQAGCLLSCLASALKWHNVRLPPDPAIRRAVQAVLDYQVAGDASRQIQPIPALRQIALDGEMNPGLLNAWLTANHGQGFPPGWLNLDLRRACDVINQTRRLFTYRGSYEGRTKPDARAVRTWLSGENILFAHLDPARNPDHHNHWVLLVGYDAAAGKFTCWDVGYHPQNRLHTAALAIDAIDKLYRIEPASAASP